MMQTPTAAQPLAAALRMAERALALGGAMAFEVSQDPFQIQLPPVLRSADISPETLRALGSMYLQAELEQAGIITAVELLSDARQQLGVRSAAVAQMIEDYTRRRRDWLDRDQRQRLFARLFGLGLAAGPQSDSSVNNEFQRLFAAFAGALLRVAEPLAGLPDLRPATPAALRQTAVDLLGNLAPRQYGNTLVAARQIQTQLRAAIDILNHEGIRTHFAVRTMWDVVRAIFADQTPDLGRLITRGQSGMRLFDWIAGSLDWFLDAASSRPAPAWSPAAAWAAQWLEASGFTRRTG